MSNPQQQPGHSTPEQRAAYAANRQTPPPPKPTEERVLETLTTIKSILVFWTVLLCLAFLLWLLLLLSPFM